MTDEASPDVGSGNGAGADDQDLVAVGTRLRSVGAAMAPTDLERADPPAGLWDRVSSSIGEDPPPSAADLRAGAVVEYAIDASDLIVDVDAGWQQFAHDNDAPELADLDGSRTVWDHFADDETRDLWRAIVSQVRASGTDARVPFRCDGPDSHRWYEMTVTPQDAGGVRFRSALVFEDTRPTIELLARHTPRDEATPEVELCSWCGRGRDGPRWVSIDQLVLDDRLLEEPPFPRVSHGICPDCRTAMSDEAERVRTAGSHA